MNRTLLLVLVAMCLSMAFAQAPNNINSLLAALMGQSQNGQNGQNGPTGNSNPQQPKPANQSTLPLNLCCEPQLTN
jgi:hypothetical protein